MNTEHTNPTSLAWPHWLLRYAASDDRGAFEQLIWSVGGSPPYGGVSYEEASAVYELLEEYQGPGMASAAAYGKVAKFLKDPKARKALELFRIRDSIASASENLRPEDAEEGLRLATELNHRGCQAYFQLLGAQVFQQQGDIAEARQRALTALTTFAALSLNDQAYMGQMIKAAVNATSFSAMEGEFAAARQTLGLVEKFGDDVLERYGVREAVTQLKSMLG
jgi:hypothetical protein